VEIGLTSRTKTVLRLAVAEAKDFRADAVGTEHLLIGLVEEGEGIAWGVLASLGVSIEGLRERLTKGLELGTNQPTGESGEPGDNGEGGGAESA
jgi:ATP-dependent Clp protease ATP-binding subunit ClpC